MKKLLLFSVLFFVLMSNIYGQDNIVVSQEFLDDAAKAFALVVAQRDEIKKNENQIAALEKLVAELEKSARTPCTIAAEKVKTDLLFWFEKLTGDAVRDKVVNKILKDVRKSGRKSIASQCGFQSKSQLMNFLDITSRLAPLLILLK